MRRLMPPPVARALDRLARPRPLRTLAGISLALLWGIIPSGAAVRLTSSGLGCPDWPLHCEPNQILPPLSSHALIEFTNRVFSALVMLVAVVTWLIVTRVPERPRPLRYWSAGAAAATVAQIPMGGITVLVDLNPLAVASHFLLALVALGFGTMAFLHASDRATGAVRVRNAWQGRLAAATALALGVGLVTGILVTAAGPHSGDSAVNRRLWNVPDAAYVHVRAVFTFAALALGLALWLWRVRGGDSTSRRLAVAWVPLVGVQIFLGEWQYRHSFPWKVVLAHVSLAGLLWTVTVALAWLVARPRVAAARATPDPDSGSAPVTVGDRLAGHAPLGVGPDS